MDNIEKNNKNLLRCIYAVIIFFLIYNLYWFYKIYIVYNIRINNLNISIKNISYSLKRKYTDGRVGVFSKWPKSVTQYFDLNKNKQNMRQTRFNNYLEIFNYDIKEFSKKIYEFEKIKNDKFYLDYTSSTYFFLNNYELLPKPPITKLKQLGIQSVKDLEYLVNDFFCVGCYYASINDSKTAILITFAPIIIIKILEDSYEEYSEPYYKIELMNLRNSACMNLMFIANNITVDKEVSVLISKYLIYLAKSEPSLIKNLEFTKARIKNELSRKPNTRNNADYFIDNVCNSKVWKDTISYIYDDAAEEIKNIESGKNPYCLYAWQQNIEEILSKEKNFEKNDFLSRLINWQRNYTFWLIAKYPQTFFIDFYNLYQKREEYLAITEGTAVALALAAYSSGKDEEKESIYDSMPKNVEELRNWLGFELPLDRMAKSTFQFYFADDYFLASSPSKNYGASEYFKHYFPYLKNKWVIHSEPTANGVIVPLPPSKVSSNKQLDRIEKLYNKIQALNALKKRFEELNNDY